MIAPATLFLGLGVPLLLAAGIVLVARTGAAEQSGWLAGLAVAVGYAAGHVGFLGWPAFPARAAEQWVPHLALVAAALAWLSSRFAPAASWAIRVVWIGVGLGLELRPMIEHQWSGAVSAAWIAALTGAVLAICLGLDWAMPRLEPRSAWSALACMFAGTAASLALSGSLALGLVAGSAAAAAAGGLAAALIGRGRVQVGRESSLVLVTIAAGLLICGAFYSALPTVSALLLLAAPLAPLVVPARILGRSAVRGALLAAGIVAAIAALAAAIAYLSLPPYDPGY